MPDRLHPERKFVLLFTTTAPTDTAALILAKTLLGEHPNAEIALEGVYERSDV